MKTNLIVTNTEITEIITPLTSGIRDNVHNLTSENTWLNILTYLQNNEWIFATLLIINALYVAITFVNIRKQKKSETSITNMFNKDGSRNEHLGRRTYHIGTPLFTMALIAFAWFAIMTIKF